MNYLHWIFLAIYGLLIVGTMVTILMDNRQPAKAMAWILVLTFMPVVGIILYIFF
jgi:cardiolipin synthase